MTTLRRLTINDANVATEYVQKYFAHDQLVFNASVRNAIEELLSAPELGAFFEVLSNDIPAGYVVLTYGFDHEFGGRIGLITDFYLLESHRGNGIGGAAMDELLNFAAARGLHAVELFVLDHNERARTFYERRGFSVTTGRKSMSIALAKA